jgi:uncharacterized membrane protein
MVRASVATDPYELFLPKDWELTRQGNVVGAYLASENTAVLTMAVYPLPAGEDAASFWAACGLGALFAVVGGACAVNFTRAFELFHAIAFPGKTNWLFDPELDAIIRILPEEFFFRCAVLILALLLVGCVLLLLAGRKRRRAA